MSATELRIRAYLYNGITPGVTVSSRSVSPLTTKDDEATGKRTVTVMLQPRRMGPDKLQVSVRMMKPGAVPLVCRERGALLSIEEMFDGGHKVWRMRMKSKVPKSPDFVRAVVYGERSGPLWIWDAACVPVDVPADVRPDTACYIEHWENQPTTPVPIPGEKLYQQCSYKKNPDAISQAGYYSHLAVTGGQIMNRSPHPTVAGAFLYTVSVENFTMTGLLATDLRTYTVGQWVQVLRVHASTATLDPVEHVIQSPDKFQGPYVYRVSPVKVVTP